MTLTIEDKLKSNGILVISEATSKTKKYKYLPPQPKARFIDEKGRMRFCYLNSTNLETVITRARILKEILACKQDS